MAWSYNKGVFGVCGNFRYAFYDLTDVKATRSLIIPDGVGAVKFCASTNETDGTDVLLAQTLKWTGTCDSNTANELVDASETFDSRLNGLPAINTQAGALKGVTGEIIYKDADELYIFNWSTGAAYDLFPAGSETYAIYDERTIQVTAGTANDDGSLFVMGR